MSSSNGAALVNTDVVRERRDLEVSGGSVTINGGGESRGLSGSSSGTCWESVSLSSSSKSSSSKSNSSPIFIDLVVVALVAGEDSEISFRIIFRFPNGRLLTCDADAADGRALACISYLHHQKQTNKAVLGSLFFLSGIRILVKTHVACSCGWS